MATRLASQQGLLAKGSSIFCNGLAKGSSVNKQWLIDRDKALYALRVAMLATMQTEDVSRAQAVFERWKQVVKDLSDEYQAN
jgi:hypothetical protein